MPGTATMWKQDLGRSASGTVTRPGFERDGTNFNLELAPAMLRGAHGARTFQGLIDGGLAAGCMQMQVDVLDPAVLVEALDHPGRHPGPLVRVSGYSACFDDLSPEMKQEIIDRTMHDLAAG